MSIYAKTAMDTIPGSCAECELGRRYGFVGDVYCRVLDDYFTGNVKPPHKERPDECPLTEMKHSLVVCPSEPQGDGWIAVKDRLPDTGVPLLIFSPHLHYEVVANYAGEGVWMDTWHRRMTYTPTHWRPLPKPPEEV